MERFKREAILLELLDVMNAHGSWCGETHVQKCVYFLEEALGVPLGLPFMLYKHGPYSFDLRDVLGEMRGNYLIDVVPRPQYGPSLVVSDSGQRLKANFPKTIRRYEGPIGFVAERLAPLRVAELERLGTALYVTRECPAASVEQRADRTVALKPHIQLEQAERAVSEVDALLAAATSRHGN